MTFEERQNLVNKTGDELVDLLTDLNNKLNTNIEKRKELYDELKVSADLLANYILAFANSFNNDDSLEVQVNNAKIEKPCSWDDNKNSAFKFTCFIGLRRKSKETTWPEDNFNIAIYDDHIESSTTGYGTFSRKDRPCVPSLLIIQGSVWANEQQLVMKANDIVDTLILNSYEIVMQQHYDIAADINAVKKEIEIRADIEENNELLNELKSHAYYIYSDDYDNKEVYKILSVSNKTVKAQRIYFSSSCYYEDKDFQYEGDIKMIRLVDNTIPMLKSGRAILTDDISEFVNKAKESCEKWKADNPDTYNAWKAKYSK